MKKYLILWLLLLSDLSSMAQVNDYYMSSRKVYDCKGNFFDSDNGIKFKDYAHNEDLIFKICVKNAQSITLTFKSFCTEKTEDYIIIYDGADTTKKKLSGKISGTTNPGTFKSTDSCLTIYFHSDGSVACDGWVAEWTTKVKPIPNPKFKSPPKAKCNATQVGIRFDQKFHCDSIKAGNFKITGILTPGITGVTAVNCDASKQTDTFTLSLASSLNRSGVYTFVFDALKRDECDSIWKLHKDTIFVINDCPIFVDLMANPDTVCAGTCTKLTAQVSGGDSTKYSFAWSPNLAGTFGPINYCPAASGWVKLTVSDGVSVPGKDSIWIEVVNPPTAQKDTTVCQSNPVFNLTSSPVGGSWAGKGITNAATGAYLPSKAGAIIDSVLYTYAGCSDLVLVTVRAISGGLPNAACPGTSPFLVTGFSPVGGVWTGTNIQSNGLFDPKDTGTFTVTYTWNGCVDTKRINVYPVSAKPFDTTCQSTASVPLVFSPIGGTWSGPGFTSTTDGIFYPPRAGGGIKTLIYTMKGCKDTTKMNVISINARADIIACPDAPPFDVQVGIPVGGLWSGVGITDPDKGTYDASFIYGIGKTWYNDSVCYTVNGCVDVKMVYVRKVSLGVDTIKFCIEADSLLLDFNSTKRSVGGGIWSGAGILGNYFKPSRAGYGSHTATYNAYGCSDSLVMHVYPPIKMQVDTTVCVTDNSFILYDNPSGGTWQGKGITNAVSGLFNPTVANVGNHKIRHFSSKGCKDSLNVKVDAKPVVKLSGFDPVYCYRDSLFTIVGTPLGGTLTGVGTVGSSFRPTVAGTGMHKLKYQFGTPTCFSADSVVVQVLDALTGNLIIDDDSLCDGESAVLNATALKGRGSNYAFSWSGSASSSRTLFVKPTQTSWQYCTFSDGCSDPHSDSLLIHVFPKIEVLATSSDIQCYGTVGFAKVLPKFTDPYSVTWFTSPLRKTDQISVPVSNKYRFTVQNKNTGCMLDSSVYVLSHPRLKAYFITTPSTGHCLNPFDPKLFVIDFTSGATSGFWDFGDGSQEPYTAGYNPKHVYLPDSNAFLISLRVKNDGGCTDSFFSQVCLDDSVYLMIPNAFSPGLDGRNDVFRIPMAGVNEVHIEIFNRWGERVFQSDDLNFAWDGVYLGKIVEQGVYPYKITYKGKNTVRKSKFGTVHVIR